MSKSERQFAVSSEQLAVSSRPRAMRFGCLLLTACCLLFFAGCRQDMQDQPRYEAYESSTFFKDGLSSRPIVEGTVPRGYLKADSQLYTGKSAGKFGAGGQGPGAGNQNQAGGGNQGGQEGGGASAEGGGSSTMQTAGGNANTQQAGATSSSSAQGRAGADDDAADFPFPVTAEVINRGQERYRIFCAMCHGETGEGDGMIVRRGYRKPPTYHEDRLRQARVGYFFRVMTEGFGAMPPYRAQVPVQDRWAIAAYIRALQLSQMNQQLAPAHNNNATEGQGESGGHR
ncbi:MAG TPA: cytochrome c [Pyrinomonadaceae bacterium]|nr:cytochrome c [Pyrinomonadaceae bacterium]